MAPVRSDWIIDGPMQALGAARQKDGRVPLTPFIVALEAEHMRNPAGFAWRLGRDFDLPSLGALGSAIAGAGRLGDAMSLLAQGFPLIQSGAETAFDAGPERAVFSYRLHDGRIWPRAGDAELTLGLVAGILARFGVAPTDGVSFQVERPSDARLAGLMEVISCPVAAAAPANAVILPPGLLDRRIASAPPPPGGARPDIVTLAERTMPLPLRLRSIIYRDLPSGRLSQAGTARALGMSERTMRRRLELEGTGFREVVDDCRHAMAVSLMRQPGRTLAEIGFELGYADQAAFTRAARRWFGEAPASARARL